MLLEDSVMPPRCLFVTGPNGPGKTHWIEQRIAEIQSRRPETKCAVLLANEGLTQTRHFARTSHVEVRCVYMPCLCCPNVADLPRTARAFAQSSRAEWLFIEVPALAATALVTEFDVVVGWPREMVVWLSREWDRARRAQALSEFQTRLLGLADQVIEQPGGRRSEVSVVPLLSFT